MSLTVSLYIVTAALVVMFLFNWWLMKNISVKNQQIADLELEKSRLKAGVSLEPLGDNR